ncbi:hypothetical protein F9U64_21505 [Gracilibacillus oryzae]|uniref:Uncharacterized protein n=1 Tax=Gracilibacillus oryzae TaxID=1672701 RepID=A0A7C8KP85_9BACI|nr:hypothetical protein [Gracilibacillus oryzae]KAB8125833.1 hypothetical protein F9U64_21505 [Gracilibacillus oryzae]
MKKRKLTISVALLSLILFAPTTALAAETTGSASNDHQLSQPLDQLKMQVTNGDGIDLESVIKRIQTERADSLNIRTIELKNEMQEWNKRLNDVNNELATARGNNDTELVKKLQAELDNIQNNMNMLILRMQSLNNKRNEAFTTLTNTIRKFEEARSSIIRNIR